MELSDKGEEINDVDQHKDCSEDNKNEWIY